MLYCYCSIYCFLVSILQTAHLWANTGVPSKSTTDYQNAISAVYNVMSLVKHIVSPDIVWTIVVALEVYEATVLVLLLDYLVHEIMQLVVFV